MGRTKCEFSARVASLDMNSGSDTYSCEPVALFTEARVLMERVKRDQTSTSFQSRRSNGSKSTLKVRGEPTMIVLLLAIARWL